MCWSDGPEVRWFFSGLKRSSSTCVRGPATCLWMTKALTVTTGVKKSPDEAAVFAVSQQSAQRAGTVLLLPQL